MRKKILLLVAKFDVGGAEQVVLNVLNNFDRSVYDISVCAVMGGGPLEIKLPKDIKYFSLTKVANIRKKQNLIEILFKILLSLPRLYSEVRKNDLIFASGEFGGTIYLGALLKTFLNKPLVGWALGEVFQFTKINPSLRGKLHQLLLPWAYRKADKIFAISKGAKDDLLKNINNLDANKICINYVPIDIKTIVERGSQRIDNKYQEIFCKPVIISLGRTEIRKGYDVLIKAHANLIKQGIDHNIVIIGPDGGEEDNLKELIKQLSVQGTVFLLGYQENPFTLMARSDIFALPSRGEGFGLVVVEAMALGLPVVVSTCTGGPVEIVQDGKLGLLGGCGNSEEFAEALKILLTDQVKYQEYKRLSLERADFFSVENYMPRFEKDLYNVIYK